MRGSRAFDNARDAPDEVRGRTNLRCESDRREGQIEVVIVDFEQPDSGFKLANFSAR